MKPRIDFLFFDAGGGHRAAATALGAVVRRQRRPWDLRLVNLQEVFDQIDVVRKIAGIRIEDCYNDLLRHGWTLGSAQLLKLLHVGIQTYHQAQVRTLTEFWSVNPPDAAVSLVPNFNRALFDAFRRVRPGAPYVTVMTDIADYPPHFWIERQDQWLVCGSEKAVAQAREIGVAEEKILRASGMILRPHFYEETFADRASERRRIGLEADTPTGLLLFGGHGSSVMLEVVDRLREVRQDLQLICLCGRNDELTAKIRGLSSRFPVHVEGFTGEVPYFMRLADFMIGKPGPGSVSEAIQMNLPVIVERNSWTLPQERYNADWVRENNLGLVVKSFRKEIAGAVETLLAPGKLLRYRAAAEAIENRAVFEIPRMLDAILSGRDPRMA